MGFSLGGAGLGSLLGAALALPTGGMSLGMGALYGGAAGGLLGGAAGDASTPSSIGTMSTLSPEQQALMSKLAPYLQERIGKGLPEYTGEWVAPATEYETAGLGRLGEYMQSGLPETTQFGLGQYKNALAGMSPEQTIDWYNTYIAPEERRIFNQQTLPGIKEAYVGPGTFWGTPRAEAESTAGQAFGTGQMSRIGSAIMSERESARNMLQYLPAMNELEQGLPLRQAQAGLQYGSLPRQLQQAELSAKFEEFKRTSPELSPILELAQGLLNTTTKAAYQTPYQASPLMELLGAVAPGVGAYLGAK